MEYVLCKYAECWADEFDVIDTWATTIAEYNKFVHNLPQTFEVSGQLGNLYANEEYSKEEFLDTIIITPITKAEYDTIKKLNLEHSMCDAWDNK